MSFMDSHQRFLYFETTTLNSRYKSDTLSTAYLYNCVHIYIKRKGDIVCLKIGHFSSFDLIKLQRIKQLHVQVKHA